MSKGLEALKYLKENKRRHWLDNDNSSESLDIIEQELKEHEPYKAIEEELGIDLVTLFKALKDGIYEKFEDGEFIKFNDSLYMPIKPHKLKLNVNKKCLERGNEYYYFKDYGKTWALTREELER